MILRAAYQSRSKIFTTCSKKSLTPYLKPKNYLNQSKFTLCRSRYFSTQKQKDEIVDEAKVEGKKEVEKMEEVEVPEPKVERIVDENAAETHPPVRRPKKSRLKFLSLLLIFGGIGYVINNSLEEEEEKSSLDSPERHEMLSKVLSHRDEESIKRAREQRIQNFRDSIQKELKKEFKDDPEGSLKDIYDREKEISEEITKILGIQNIEDPSRYEEITSKIREVHKEIQTEFAGFEEEKSKVERELERLNRLKNLVEKEIYELNQEFDQAERDVEDYRETQLETLKEKSGTFLQEFSKIKAENESVALSYLHKVQDLIQEGEEFIKDIDTKIPKDLKSVKEDVRARYIKLKFMIKEYYRDHESATTSYERLKQYFNNYDKDAFDSLERGTDQMADIRNMKDEKAILESMISKMRNQIEVTREDLGQRKRRLEKIHHMSVSNKIDMVQYYLKIDSLVTKMNLNRLTGGDISSDLKHLLEISQGQDELLIAVVNDLLSKPCTSTNIVTKKKLKEFFAEKRNNYYWDCFQRKKTLLDLFTRTMYYGYTSLLLDKVKFEKKYAVPHILKDDSTICRDVRLMNYIEEALEEGNVEEAHLFATQMSSKLNHDMKEFIDMCELYIKFQMSCDTLRDHSNNLISSVFRNK